MSKEKDSQIIISKEDLEQVSADGFKEGAVYGITKAMLATDSPLSSFSGLPSKEEIDFESRKHANKAVNKELEKLVSKCLR